MKNIYARGVSSLLARRTLEHRLKKVLDFRASDLVQRNFERRNTDGMDVIGMNPRPRRRIFRHNLFSWSPLCTFIEIFAPEEAKPCRNWRSNNGDGLDAVQSGRANRLQEVIAAAVEECLRQMRDQPYYDWVAHALTQGLPAFVAFLRSCGGFEIR